MRKTANVFIYLDLDKMLAGEYPVSDLVPPQPLLWSRERRASGGAALAPVTLHFLGKFC